MGARWVRLEVARLQGVSLVVPRGRAAERVQDHGQLLRQLLLLASLSSPGCDHLQVTLSWPRNLPCPITWQGFVFLPTWERVGVFWTRDNGKVFGKEMGRSFPWGPGKRGLGMPPGLRGTLLASLVDCSCHRLQSDICSGMGCPARAPEFSLGKLTLGTWSLALSGGPFPSTAWILLAQPCCPSPWFSIFPNHIESCPSYSHILIRENTQSLPAESR